MEVPLIYRIMSCLSAMTAAKIAKFEIWWSVADEVRTFLAQNWEKILKINFLPICS